MKKTLLLFLVFSLQFGCTLSDPEMLEVLMEIKAQNEALKKEIDEIKSQLANLDKNYQKILESLSEDKKSIEELKKQVETLKNQINLQLDQFKKLSEQLATQGAEIEKLSKEIAELKASIAELIKKLEELINQQNSNAFFEQNGTIKCPNAKVGDKGIVNGKQYEAVDRELLIKRRDEGADLTCVCTSLVTDMSELFGKSAPSKISFNQPIGGWDVSNVTDMRGMFFNTTFNQPINNWDVSKVLDTRWMFSYSLFNQPLGNWIVSNVIDMGNMFRTSVFNQPIGNWDVSNVTNMSAIFGESPFNQPIGNWDVKKVSNMNGMFYKTPFNQNISSWCVNNILSKPNNFSTNSPLSSENEPKWGTCPSTSVLTSQIIVDTKEFELSQFVTCDEEDKEPTGYYIESWIWPKWPNPNEGYGVSLFFISSAPKSIDVGVYKIVDIVSLDRSLNKNEAAGELDILFGAGNEENLVEGTLEVKKENDIYTIKLEAVTDKSKKVTVFFEGNLKLISDC
jgi:surface protein